MTAPISLARTLLGPLLAASCIATLLWHPPAACEGSDVVNRCQELERDFNFDAVLRECSASASDSRLPTQERLIFLRLLGIAHASLGDEDKAQLWFQQLLMLDPEFEMSGGQSPRLLSTFKKAKEKFLKEGHIQVVHTPPPAPNPGQKNATKLSFLLDDRLSQVVRGEVTLTTQVDESPALKAEPVPLVKGGKDAEGRTLWTANLPAPPALLGEENAVTVHYSVRIFNGGGDEVKNRSDPVEHSLRFEKLQSDSMLVPILVGSASVGAVLFLAAGAAAGGFSLWCLSDAACSGPAPSQEEGEVRVRISLGLR